jgi:predicted HNH restriction endonuclease
LEGARVDVVQSQPERDQLARAACLAKHGYACVVCGLDFGKKYGRIGQGFIHVHHLTPLASGERLVNPELDMQPLCPNCHAMAHRRNPPFSVEELLHFIKRHDA